MPNAALSLLAVQADPALRAWLVRVGLAATHVEDAVNAGPHDAVLYGAATAEALAALAKRPELAQLAFDHAVVVLTPALDLALEAELLNLGVEAIAPPTDRVDVERAIRQAVLRKRVERSTRIAYATDLATGLPHEAQLIEHMTQLIALRERQPSPMALIAMRVEGFAGTAARLGGESANVLRRKVAVRLRGGLRAGDVVAAMGPQMFGVLLAHIDAPGDAERVAAKLVRALQQPLLVAGQPCPVAASIGLAQYPLHGKDARALLQRAAAQAGGLATQDAARALAGVPGAAAQLAEAANDGRTR